jgi:hypothetical protein
MLRHECNNHNPFIYLNNFQQLHCFVKIRVLQWSIEALRADGGRPTCRNMRLFIHTFLAQSCSFMRSDSHHFLMMWMHWESLVVPRFNDKRHVRLFIHAFLAQSRSFMRFDDLHFLMTWMNWESSVALRFNDKKCARLDTEPVDMDNEGFSFFLFFFILSIFVACCKQYFYNFSPKIFFDGLVFLYIFFQNFKNLNLGHLFSLNQQNRTRPILSMFTKTDCFLLHFQSMGRTRGVAIEDSISNLTELRDGWWPS